MLYSFARVHFFFLFFSATFVRAISLEPLLAETPNWVCCLVLLSNFALLLTIQFALLFIFFSFFSATILSGPYLWNRYSQRLQIECAAWSCGLILHCCLPSNSLRYFLFFNFFGFFCPDFVLAISLEPLLAETPNWVYCLVLWSNFALLLTIQFPSLISSLINIISLLLTTFHWTKVRGIAPRSHTGRPRNIISLLLTTFDLTKVRGIAPRSHTGRPRSLVFLIGPIVPQFYVGQVFPKIIMLYWSSHLLKIFSEK